MPLFVGGLPWGFTDADLKKLVEEVSPVATVKVVIDRETGRSKGYGFINLVDESLLDSVIAKIDKTEVEGRTLRANVANPKEGRTEHAGKDKEREPPPPRREVRPIFSALQTCLVLRHFRMHGRPSRAGKLPRPLRR